MKIKINSFQFNLSTFKKKKYISNYILGILATFQIRTCAMYSSLISKERSSKYENNYITFYLYDKKPVYNLNKKDYLQSIFQKRVWKQKREE
jgi:hypothetical protein